MHELIVYKKAVSGQIEETKQFKIGLDFFNFDKGTSEVLTSIDGLELAYGEEVIISFGLKKTMENFELYSNDPARGVNMNHMPIFYQLKETGIFRDMESRAILI